MHIKNTRKLIKSRMLLISILALVIMMIPRYCNASTTYNLWNYGLDEYFDIDDSFDYYYKKYNDSTIYDTGRRNIQISGRMEWFEMYFQRNVNSFPGLSINHSYTIELVNTTGDFMNATDFPSDQIEISIVPWTNQIDITNKTKTGTKISITFNVRDGAATPDDPMSIKLYRSNNRFMTGVSNWKITEFNLIDNGEIEIIDPGTDEIIEIEGIKKINGYKEINTGIYLRDNQDIQWKSDTYNTVQEYFTNGYNKRLSNFQNLTFYSEGNSYNYEIPTNKIEIIEETTKIIINSRKYAIGQYYTTNSGILKINIADGYFYGMKIGDTHDLIVIREGPKYYLYDKITLNKIEIGTISEFQEKILYKEEEKKDFQDLWSDVKGFVNGAYQLIKAIIKLIGNIPYLLANLAYPFNLIVLWVCCLLCIIIFWKMVK